MWYVRCSRGRYGIGRNTDVEVLDRTLRKVRRLSCCDLPLTEVTLLTNVRVLTRGLTFVSLCVLANACTRTPDGDPLTYALRAQIPDSLDRQHVVKFLQAFEPASGTLRSAGAHLSLVQLAESLASRSPESVGVQRLAAQIAATERTFLGDHRRAFTQMDDLTDDAGRAREAPLGVPNVRDLRASNAIDAVLVEAAKRRLILINEAHHVPRHRAFTLELLPGLWRAGFRYLAVEALNATDTLLERRGFVVRASGHYTQEPWMAATVREALRIGFRLIPYEVSDASSQDARERGQAERIVSATFARDSSARLVIHAGFAHISERGGIAGAPSMAEYLATLTGLDPLSVDQTVMRERITQDREEPNYRALVAASRSPVPFALQRADGTWWSARPGSYDLTIVTPPEEWLRTRARWVWRHGERTAVPLPRGVCKDAEQCAIQVRAVGEPADATPIDAVFWTRGEEVPMLALPPGRFEVLGQDASWRLLGRVTISVS